MFIFFVVIVLFVTENNIHYSRSLRILTGYNRIYNLYCFDERHFQYLLSLAEERGHMSSSSSKSDSLASVVRRVSVSSASDPKSRLVVKDDDSKRNNLYLKPENPFLYLKPEDSFLYLKPEDPFLSSSRSVRSTSPQTTSHTKIVITPDDS